MAATESVIGIVKAYLQDAEPDQVSERLSPCSGDSAVDKPSGNRDSATTILHEARRVGAEADTTRLDQAMWSRLWGKATSARGNKRPKRELL